MSWCPADSPGDCVVLCSWQVGDQILEVNGRSFLSILHDEAVKLLKSSQHLILTVKDVGRLPHARTTVDETKWIASSRIGVTTTSSAGSGHTVHSAPGPQAFSESYVPICKDCTSPQSLGFQHQGPFCLWARPWAHSLCSPGLSFPWKAELHNRALILYLPLANYLTYFLAFSCFV